MKTRRWTMTVVALAAALVLLRAPTVKARDDDHEVRREGERARPARAADIDVFWDALAPYGEWMDDAPWGWVWIPTSVPAGWRPYTNGSWMLTDWGWTWDSNWDWGWAPFHYGRWIDDDSYGWMWIPGVDWGPAWVLWNEGDDWIGWAPLPPQVVWEPDSGLRFGHLDLDRLVPPRDYVFVRREHFADRDLDRDIAPRPHNVTIAPMTRNVTRYETLNGEVVDRSIPPERIEKAIGHPVHRVRVEDVESIDRSHDAHRAGAAELPMFRPRIERGQRLEPRAEEQLLRQSPPAAVVQRQTEEERALQERHAEERRALERVQEQERFSAARRGAANAMAQRQEMERSEMRSLQQRDQEQMMRRHQWEQSRMRAAPRQAEPRPHR